MNQTPLTNMEGYKVKATSESYNALIELGYIDTVMDKETRLSIYDPISLFVEPTGIINSSSNPKLDKKQAYYHNGHFYDKPYEEFTITEEKVPFPELEDIEWVMVDAPEWWTPPMNLNKCYFGEKYINLSFESYNDTKILYENSKDFKVTWACKEKIDRRLHKNRPLALAIGRWLVLHGPILIKGEKRHLSSIGNLSASTRPFRIKGESRGREECTLPDNYIIPNQVLQWMKEYHEQGIK